jgi:hypothetical protein
MSTHPSYAALILVEVAASLTHPSESEEAGEKKKTSTAAKSSRL